MKVQQLLVAYGVAPPSVAPQSFNYVEDQATGYAIGTVATTGTAAVDFRFSATGNGTSSDGYYAIDSSGVITLTASGASGAPNDYETSPNTFTHDVQAKNAAGAWSAAATMTLNVLDLNSAAGWTVVHSTGSISNDNMLYTATGVGSSSGAGANGSTSGSVANLVSRKVYCEFEFPRRDGMSRSMIGVTSSQNLGYQSGSYTFFSSADTVTAGGYPPNGYSDNGSITSDNTYTFTTTDRLGIAFDASTSNRKMWISKNGTWLNGDPATNTGGFAFTNAAGAFYFTATLLTTSSSGVTFKAQIFPNAASQLYAAPSGYSVYT